MEMTAVGFFNDVLQSYEFFTKVGKVSAPPNHKDSQYRKDCVLSLAPQIINNAVILSSYDTISL